MFCQTCGSGDQRANAYCTRCGVWLVDSTAPKRRRLTKSQSPEEKMRAVTWLGGANSLMALASAIMLYVTFAGTSAPIAVYIAAAFSLVIAIHQAISFLYNVQMRQRLKHGREERGLTLPIDSLEAPLALKQGDAASSVSLSVTENTTELLEPVSRPRARHTEPR